MSDGIFVKSEKIQRHISYFLNLTVIGTFFVEFVEGQWFTAFACVLTLFSFYLPGILAKNLKVRLPLEFKLAISLFLYGCLFLGEIQNFYGLFWWWDTLLHTVSGVILSFAGFLILLTLYNQRRLEISAFLLSLFSFCFALALGALWEIFEYTMDQSFGLSMQEDGLNDTMLDLIVDALGSLLTAIMGFIYIKFRKSPIGLFEAMIKGFLSQNRLHRVARKLKIKVKWRSDV